MAATNEMRLPYNGSLGCFNATICETGMEQRTLFDAYLIAVKDGINRTDATEIIVFLLENEVHMDYFGHIITIWKIIMQIYSK